MSDNARKISELEARLDSLVRTQIDFQLEVAAIRKELSRLRNADGEAQVKQYHTIPQRTQLPSAAPTDSKYVPPKSPEPQPEARKYPPSEARAPNFTYGRGRQPPSEDPKPKAEPAPSVFSNYVESAQADLEKFIGENLISKIGIIVLILGVGIGAKYAIDNNLISPLTRIILGYLAGFALLGVAVWLKPNYQKFSAVLLSGGMAIMYFITYFAYSSYQLIDQPTSFVLMVMFTVFTVAAAIFYNLQVIAHIGLVGAYAVPFLLSNDSGNHLALFAYVAILNSGVLAVAVKRYWRWLFYTSSFFSWSIFAVWFVTKYDGHLYLALGTLAVFYLLFFATKLIQSVLHEESDQQENSIAIIGTTVVFYFFCFTISDSVGTVTGQTSVFVFLAAAALLILLASYRFLAIREFWRWIFYASSVFTWAILGAWMANKYSSAAHLYLALGTLAAFFLIFFAARIMERIGLSDGEPKENSFAVVATTVIFYLFAFAISSSGATTFGRVIVFSYLAIAALLILLLSYRFLGRILVFAVYPFTWLIFGGWFGRSYSPDEHLLLAGVFVTIYFLTFYVSTLIYRLTSDKVELPEMAGMMMTNSFIFYGIGYSILDSRAEFQPLAGFFTVAHSAFHSVVAQIVSRAKQDVVNVIQILTILIITFATIAVPVQFDGNFVTLIWSVEAAALFHFGRMRQIRFFEYFAYPLMVLAVISKVSDWLGVYFERGIEPALQPFANGDMITSLVFVAAFAFVYFANSDDQKESVLDETSTKFFGYLTAVVCLVALYNTFRMEIGNFYNLQAVVRGSTIMGISDLFRFNAVSQFDYTMLFLMVMAAVNLQKVRSRIVAFANIGLSLVTLFVFLTIGLTVLYELRESYLAGNTTGLFGLAISNVGVRYLSYAFVVGLMLSLFAYRRSRTMREALGDRVVSVGFDAILYPSLLVILSCEVMNVAAHVHIVNADKYGLSILWGVFALVLIVIGIAMSKKHLRVAAIVLFAVTLVKLFFYDITDLGTIPKTILFVSLGLLLLVISFLYNKYKESIFGPDPAGD